MNITVLHNQSVLDLAVQVYGTADAAFHLAKANEISVTEMLVPGTILDTPEFEDAVPEVVNFFMAKNIKPATALTAEDLFNANPEGIDYMIIGTDFIVE